MEIRELDHVTIQRDHEKCLPCCLFAWKLHSACDVMEPDDTGASFECLPLGNGMAGFTAVRMTRAPSQTSELSVHALP